MTCRLCGSSSLANFQSWPFFRCTNCLLICKHESVFLTQDEAHRRYLTHQNTFDNLGYRKFLQPAVDAVLEFAPLSSKVSGLDFGCGPGPVLSELLTRAGYSMAIYDPLFFPERPQGKFDFVTCTEVVEHFEQPLVGFEELFSYLQKESALVVMTETYPPNQPMAEWYYARDFTHLHFYSPETFEWIAQHFKRSLHIRNPRLAIFC